MFQIGLKNFLLLKKLETLCHGQHCAIDITVPWTYVISDLKGEEIVGTFHEKFQIGLKKFLLLKKLEKVCHGQHCAMDVYY